MDVFIDGKKTERPVSHIQRNWSEMSIYDGSVTEMFFETKPVPKTRSNERIIETVCGETHIITV